MSTPHDDPFVNIRRLFPLGPSSESAAPQVSQDIVPFGVRYAVRSVTQVAGTRPKVSINTPTAPDGKPGQPPKTDDVITEGSD